MRCILGLIACVAMGGGAVAQSSKISIAPPGNPGGYWLTKNAEPKIRIAGYEKVGKFFHITDQSGRETQLYETTVKKLEAITDGEVQAEEKAKQDAAVEKEARIRARAKALADEEAETRKADSRGPEASNPPGDQAESTAPSSPLYRSSGRTSAPSSGRNAARKSPPTDSSNSSSSSLGTTPKGFKLEMGPRGGIYHISKNGNKVYQRRK